MKSFSGTMLFDKVSLDVNSGEKIALIGRNGTGKSTLIKLILGELLPDSGDLFINRSVSIGYLSQDVIDNLQSSLIDEMKSVYSKVIDLENQIKLILDQMKTDHSDALLKRYALTEDEYSRLGGYDYLTTIDMILSRFGFQKSEYDRIIDTFSGGEKTRVAFAKLLLKKPDLLILDEPTNHMDIDIIEWLEDYLRRYPGAVLCVTHDKYFINRVAEKIYEIDQQTTSVYYGNYDQYESEKVKRYEVLLKQYQRQSKEIAHLQSFVDRFRYKATKAKSAQDRIKKINRIQRIDKPTNNQSHVRFQFKSKRPTDAVIIRLEDVSIGYDKPLQAPLSFEMRGYEKVGIIGPNGIGKTTLIKTIMGTLEPLDGRISFVKELKIGYFDQNLSSLDDSLSVINTVHNRYPQKTLGEVRKLLALFLFVEEDVFKSVSVLSGGERVRLTLLMMMLEEPELLILDEPTNHLDIDTKNIVEDVFDQFEGPILFISHDRYFINKVATTIMDFHQGDIQVFSGNYDEYKSSLVQAPLNKPSKQQVVKQKRPGNELQSIEKTMEKLHKEQETLKEELFLETVYMNPTLFSQKELRIQEIDEELTELLEKIENISDISVD